ncbi:MAG: citrate lyase acyl carrier protein [Synergistaceae bacterium]|nr:citrate lyase acyl carrier protein [Synergistaceae bacterium]
MELKAVGTAGTLESSDVMITLEPTTDGKIDLALESSVINQYGRQIKATVLESLERLGVKSAKVVVNDHGALDCTIKARVECAFYRGCQCDMDGKFDWGGVIR